MNKNHKCYVCHGKGWKWATGELGHKYKKKCKTCKGKGHLREQDYE